MVKGASVDRGCLLCSFKFLMPCALPSPEPPVVGAPSQPACVCAVMGASWRKTKDGPGDRRTELRGRPQLVEEGGELCKSPKPEGEGMTNVPP